ncbi:unnamed protein product [Arabis nemorensis]|uniref:Uncharacterized protein n=1 Tax=Arabis nemorensis TaxID=586526 RepID=A0A565ANT4_9BRAS|nr:unnamed protein product [Arabis nemorensis]
MPPTDLSKLIFNNKIITTEEALTAAIVMAKEWTNAQQTLPTPVRRKPLRIRKPEADTIICQSDVTWNTETKTAGLGWIIKLQGARPLGQSKNRDPCMLPPHGRGFNTKRSCLYRHGKGFKKTEI